MAIVGVGLLVAASSSWTAWTLNRHNERRLLQVQTAQAGDVLASTILSIENPLTTALGIESATGGDVRQFTSFMSRYVGPGQLFSAASLWQVNGDSVRVVSAIGAPARLQPSSQAARSFVGRAFHSTGVVVTGIPPGVPQAVGYAIASPSTSTYVIYAERLIPANRRVQVESDSAFSDLDYATYLGASIRSSDLATTNVSPSRLPLTGNTVRIGIPFGDTTLTLVTTPSRPLGGPLGQILPWAFLAGGILITVAAAILAERLGRRRREAEQDAQTITRLYDDLDDLYAQQRTIAETLQRALLPRRNPELPNLEVASRYVAGAAGVDVGGDWYSLIAIDENRFGFVVGDVSGRGIQAATMMAQLRFTMRAYLLEGHPPAAVLGMCARQVDILNDGHFATAIVGVADLTSREVTLANAGHPSPLVITGQRAQFVSTSVGLPLGVEPGAYGSTSVVMAPGSILLAFTDGLIERRDEDIQLGFERLAEAATLPFLTLDHLLADLLGTMSHEQAPDDIAILAFRWTEAEAGDASSPNFELRAAAAP